MEICVEVKQNNNQNKFLLKTLPEGLYIITQHKGDLIPSLKKTEQKIFDWPQKNNYKIKGPR